MIDHYLSTCNMLLKQNFSFTDETYEPPPNFWLRLTAPCIFHSTPSCCWWLLKSFSYIFISLYHFACMFVYIRLTLIYGCWRWRRMQFQLFRSQNTLVSSERFINQSERTFFSSCKLFLACNMRQNLSWSMLVHDLFCLFGKSSGSEHLWPLERFLRALVQGTRMIYYIFY